MRKFLFGICLAASALMLRAEDLSVILQHMNASAPAFHGMSADIQMITYTAVIDDKLTENGSIKMQKKNGAVRAVVDFSQPQSSARDIGFFGKTVRIYYPNANYFQDYEIGKNGDVINQFLLLGFGSSGDELSKSYTITQEGTEQVSGVTATKLMLVPKDQKMLEHLSKAELWIPEGKSDPIQQQFYESSGNYRKVTYVDVEINPTLKGTLEIKMRPGAEQHSS
jgi:outer membrane lipoprotein-sorting protein